MSRPQLAFDGLQRCVRQGTHKRALPRVLNAQRPMPIQWPQYSNQYRRYGSNETEEHEDTGSHDIEEAWSLYNEKFNQPTKKPDEKAGALSSFFEKHKQVEKKTIKAEYRGPNPVLNPVLTPIMPDLNTISLPLLVDALRRLRMPYHEGSNHLLRSRYLRILHVVRYLLRHRKYTPDALIFESLMAAMADPAGSSVGVKGILQDMGKHSVPLTPDVCYLALEALSIHPDYILRQEVIELMEKHWFEFTMPAKQSIAVAMLREGQFELAMDKLTQLFEDPQKVDLWVYDIFILEFGREGFFDEMLHVLKKRKHARGTDMPFRSIQLMALNIFSQGFHHEGTRFVWADVIDTSIHNPSNGILENVLATGARHGDTILAAQALEKLSSRGKPGQQHNDAVIEAFANSGDVAGALSMLNVLQNTGWLVDQGSTRPILQALLKNPGLIDKLVSAIQTMHKDAPVPLEAVMVTIEAIAQAQTSEAAMPLFNDTHILTGKSPRLIDFGPLLRHCAKTETKYELAKAYNVELAKMDTTPAPATERKSSQGDNNNSTIPKTWMDRVDAGSAFDVIIPACADMNDFELAFKFIGHAQSAVPDIPVWRSAGWVEPFMKKALDAEHPAVWKIVDLLDQGNDAPAMMIRRELQRRRIERTSSKS